MSSYELSLMDKSRPHFVPGVIWSVWAVDAAGNIARQRLPATGPPGWSASSLVGSALQPFGGTGRGLRSAAVPVIDLSRASRQCPSRPPPRARRTIAQVVRWRIAARERSCRRRAPSLPLASGQWRVAAPSPASPPPVPAAEALGQVHPDSRRDRSSSGSRPLARATRERLTCVHLSRILPQDGATYIILV